MKKVLIYDLATKQKQEIPVAELSSDMIPISVMDEHGLWVDVRKVHVSAEPRHGSFDPKRKKRIMKIRDALKEVEHGSYEDWELTFRCDQHPDREIRIWEWIAHAYTSLVAKSYHSMGWKLDAFRLCLRWTMSKDPEAVLATVDLKGMSRDEATAVLENFIFFDPTFFKGKTADTLSTIFDFEALGSIEQFATFSKEAEVIFAVDWSTGETECVYGRSVLERIVAQGNAEAIRVAGFAADFQTEGRERIAAAVQVTKGSHDLPEEG